MNKLLPLFLHFLNCCLDSSGVREFELDCRCRFGNLFRPFILSKARLSCHYKGPYTKVIGPGEIIHETIIAHLLERQTQSILIQGRTCRSIFSNRSKTGNTLDLHSPPPSGS